MQFEGLFSKKNIFFLECHLLQILLGALRVNTNGSFFVADPNSFLSPKKLFQLFKNKNIQG